MTFSRENDIYHIKGRFCIEMHLTPNPCRSKGDGYLIKERDQICTQDFNIVWERSELEEMQHLSNNKTL